MNLWQCDHTDANGKQCSITATGVGGAVGLRAIGWYFRRGGPLLCPAHRPDPVLPPEMLADHHMEDERDRPCSLCRATIQAENLQRAIGRWLLEEAEPGYRMPPSDHAPGS